MKQKFLKYTYVRSCQRNEIRETGRMAPSEIAQGKQ